MASETTTRTECPTLTITRGDVWTCSCGNRADLDGFYPVVTDDKLAREVSPDIGGQWDGQTMTCAACGATYAAPVPDYTTDDTRTVCGQYRVFVSYECVCTYGQAGHTLNCLNYNGRRAERAAGEEVDRA